MNQKKDRRSARARKRKAQSKEAFVVLSWEFLPVVPNSPAFPRSKSACAAMAPAASE